MLGDFVCCLRPKYASDPIVSALRLQGRQMAGGKVTPKFPLAWGKKIQDRKGREDLKLDISQPSNFVHVHHLGTDCFKRHVEKDQDRNDCEWMLHTGKTSRGRI